MEPLLIAPSDLPVTLFQAAQSSIVISPHNFFLESPSQRVTQAVTVKVADQANATSQVVVDYHGANLQTCNYDTVCSLFASHVRYLELTK
jgi:hypothetical protein